MTQLKKHILVYSQYFYPEQFRINDICIELVNRGYKVSVVTGIPNYPDGKFYKGYSWKDKRKENWNGIDIYRMPIFPRGNNSLGLILNYSSFVVAARLMERTLPKDIDLVFTYEVSPMTQALPAIWYAQKHDVPHTIYVMDLWPENVQAVAKVSNKMILRQLDKMVDYIYNKSSMILASSNSFVESIVSRGIRSEKVKFWPQYAEELYSVKDPTNKEVSVSNYTERTFVFAGNIGEAQGLRVLPRVAEILMKANVKFKFVIIGDGRDKDNLIKLVRLRKVEKYFEFIERQPAEKIPYYLAKFDVALITLSSNKIFEKTIPAKVQSLMACGMPLLVSADGEVQSIILEAKAGLVSDAGQVEKLAENIITYTKMDKKQLEALSRQSLAYYKANFDKKLLMNQFEELMNEGA